MGIFSEYAPLYWGAGLPCIPLQKASKSPVTQGWSRFSTEEIPDALKAQWLSQYPDGNVGLPLGQQSGLVAIDIDTDDPKVIELLKGILPATPWVRRGKKGAVWIYRWAGHKTARVRDAEGKSLLELLSSGTQIVLPPSIHPDTQMPYVANANLWDILPTIPALPKQAEILIRQGLLESGIKLSTKGYSKVTEYISVGNRDSKMISMAGLFAKSVWRGERTLINAIGEMRTWVDNFVEKVAGDPIDPEKGVERLIDFLKKDIIEGKRVLPTGWDDDLSEEEKAKFRAQFGQVVEQWSTKQVMDFLTEQFSTHDRVEGLNERRAAIEKAMVQVAGSTVITPMDHDMIFNFISQSMMKSVTVGALRKRLYQLTKQPEVGENHGELATMVLTDLEQFGEVRFAHSKFWRWVGSHWEELEESDVLSRIISDYGSLPAARRHSDHKGVVRTMQALRTRDLSESPIRGLNFVNGFLTSDLRLLPHSPDFGMTYVLPFPYDPTRAGASHRFLGFLNTCWGQDPDYVEKVQALREALAVTLFGMAAQYQKAFCVYGQPFSGKSVLLEIIRGILPPEATCNVAPDTWDDKFMPTRMLGKLVNFCGELSEQTTIPGDRFKYIVDGGFIEGQLKGMQIFDFKPTCAHWFASNHLPRSRDSSTGFSRRWQFFHFTRQVPAAERIVGLANDIAAEERDAIVAWAVSALPDLERAQNYTAPASHMRLIEEMSGMNNSVRFFLKGGPVKSVGHDKTISEVSLHGEYWVFCKTQAGAKPVSLKIFRQRMMELESELGFEIVRNKADESVEYRGLELAGR